MHTRYGPPEVVRVVDVPTPRPTDEEVLVKVHATTVNRTDCGFRAAKPWLVRPFSGLVRPRVTILGNEFAGEVAAVGRAVTSFAVGDRVFGYDDTAWGAHAEYLTIRQDATLARIPANLDYAQSAPATEGFHYALAGIAKAGVRTGQWVLVNGATGAIGSAAVQLLASRGAHVTGVCGTAHVDMVRQLGADRVIDRSSEDFTRHDQAMATRLRDLLESGQFRPVIDRSYPLADIVEAYRYVETGQKVGSVVITIDHTA